MIELEQTGKYDYPYMVGVLLKDPIMGDHYAIAGVITSYNERDDKWRPKADSQLDFGHDERGRREATTCKIDFAYLVTKDFEPGPYVGELYLRRDDVRMFCDPPKDLQDKIRQLYENTKAARELTE